MGGAGRGGGPAVGKQRKQRDTVCNYTAFPHSPTLLLLLCLPVLGPKYLEAAAREPRKHRSLRDRIELKKKDYVRAMRQVTSIFT